MPFMDISHAPSFACGLGFPARPLRLSEILKVHGEQLPYDRSRVP